MPEASLSQYFAVQEAKKFLFLLPLVPTEFLSLLKRFCCSHRAERGEELGAATLHLELA